MGGPSWSEFLGCDSLIRRNLVISKYELDRLRAQRRQHKPMLTYEMKGYVQSQVKSQVDAEREKKIAQGDHSLKQALYKMRNDRASAVNDGLAKAHFNQKAKGMKL